jgi:(R,R)-butanediol dehydrogenase / meso-butanediol dehydrogenase / diacetyl reductase
MRAVAIAPDRSLGVVDLAEPDLAADEVRIQVRYCGICGSDLHMRDVPAMMPTGAVLGHEFTGVISEIGAAVSNWALGERVVVNPFDPCGRCEKCTAGRPELCPVSGRRGVGLGQRYGAYAETTVAPQASLFRLPDVLSDAYGALTEPLAVGLHGVNMAQARPTERCAVLGAGPIGIMTALGLRAKGFDKVVVVEPTQLRRETVAGLGFAVSDVAGQEESIRDILGGPPALIFDCTGHPAGLPSAVDMAESAGQIIVIGVPFSPSTLNTAAIAIKELQVRGSLAYSAADISESIGLLAAGQIPCADLITTVAPLEQAEEWFAELASGTTRQIKILLRP